MPESSPAPNVTTVGRRFRPARRLPFVGARLLLLSLFALSAGTLIAAAGDLTAKSPTGPVAPAQAVSPAGKCTPTWTDSGSVSLVADQQWLTGVSAVSPDDVWAVGLFNRGTWSDSLVEHWNGERWRVVSSPQGNTIPYAVEAIHADDVWVVGAQGLTEYWNGSQWTVLPGPDLGSGYTNLNDISAVSSSDIWTVGEHYDNSDSTTRILIEHWNGSQWNVVPVPATGTVGVLLGVEAISSNDAWAVGHTGDGNTLALHWDGVQWTVVPSPNPGTGHTLNAVSAVSSNDVWAVGAYDDPDDPRLGTPLTMHWDGSQWMVVPGPEVGEEGGRLESVASLGSNDMWAVGAPNLTAHWDGIQWMVVPGPDTTERSVLYDLAADNTGGLWAVGLNFTGSPYGTLALRYDPLCSPPVPTPTACPIQFSDVPADSPFYSAIRCLTCAGATGGYEDGTFRPGDAVTRGQLAKIVARGAGLEGDTGEQVYEDVPPSSTYYEWINRLSELHVVGGYPCGTSADEPCVGPANRPYFRPGASATRGQIAKIVSEVAGYNELTVSRAFADVPPSTPFEAAIDRLRLHGDVTGYPCGTRPDEPCDQGYNRSYFRPGNNATRGQVAKIVAHAFHPECSTAAP